VTHKSILFTQPTLPATVLTVFFYTPISVLMDSKSAVWWVYVLGLYI